MTLCTSRRCRQLEVLGKSLGKISVMICEFAIAIYIVLSVALNHFCDVNVSLRKNGYEFYT